jgi:hypothetical protein
VFEAREKVIFLRGQQEISAMVLGVSSPGPVPVGAMGLGTWKRLAPPWWR